MGAARCCRCVIAVAPEVGAEAVVLAGFGIALISGAMFVVLLGLKGAWRLTFGAVLEGLALALSFKVFGKRIALGGPLRELDHRVVNQITEAALGYEQAMGYWFHQSARLQGWIVDETYKIARDSFHFGEWLIRTHIPVTIHHAIDSLRGTTHTLTHTVTRIEHTTIKVVRLSKATAHAVVATTVPGVAIPHLGEWQWIHRHWKALTTAVAAAGAIAAFPPFAIPRLFPRLGRLERGESHIFKRLHRVEALLGAAAFAAAMANVLGLRSASCLRSGNIGKVARRLCGLDSAILGGLLAGLIVLEGQISLEEFARELLSIEQELGNLVLAGFSELDGVRM